MSRQEAPSEEPTEGKGEVTNTTQPFEAEKRRRGPTIVFTDEERANIVRLVNVEKKTAASVARDMSRPVSTVWRVACAARGVGPTLASAERKTPKVDADMPVFPFPGDELPSLKGRRLTVEEKYYLACLVNIKRISCGRVARGCDIAKDTVAKYAKRALEGKPLVVKGGTPPLLDAESSSVLSAMAELQGDSRPTRDAVKATIYDEAGKTLQRRKNERDALGRAQDQYVGRGKKPARSAIAKYLALYGFAPE